ncbi:MAG: polyprenyl synthetase family protein [Anaerolineae bacterium]|nr:polyprenyl synthetase family protein [Anaerolineae bacterium]
MTIDNVLQAVEELLFSTIDSDVFLLRQTSEHILNAGGKRLRPRLLLLAHEATGGHNWDVAASLAAAVEIIHTATLVHDDINDHGTLRRGRETVNSRWGGTFALLTGDYMFTKAYELMLPHGPALNAILARAAVDLVEGETIQIQAAKEGRLDRDTYMQIIAKKTAALFVAAVKLGAMAANAAQAQVDALHRYAFNLGLAFQITDDVLDLVADPQQLGKNVGVDLSQGRGFVIALQDGQSATPAAATPVAIESDNGTLLDSLGRGLLGSDRALNTAVQKGRRKARELAGEASASLDALPPSDARDELRALTRKIIERDH